MAQTNPVCPTNTASQVYVFKFQILILLSLDPDANL